MTWSKLIRAGLGLLAVVLLVSNVGCGGESDADVTPPSLTFDGTSVISTERTRTISGTVEAGARVLVSVGLIEDVAGIEEDAVVSGTTWTKDITLRPGVNAVFVRAEDAVGNSTTLQFVLTYDAVTFEVYTTPIAGTSQAIYGMVDPTLQEGPALTLNGLDVPVMVTGNVWSADLTNLVTGDNTVSIKVTDPSLPLGSLTGTLVIGVNADAPALAFDAAGIMTTAVPSQTLTGTFDTASGVNLVPFPSEPLPVGVTTPGTWAATFPRLSIGKNPVTATASVLLTSGLTLTTTARSLVIVSQAPPLVRQVSPAQGALQVDPTGGVTAQFDVAMNEASVESGFTLSNSLGPVSTVFGYDSTTRTATLTPSSGLAAGTTYTATLATSITDSVGTPLQQELSWSFTTAPTTP